MLKKIKVETRLAAQTENGEDMIATESKGTAVIDRDGLLLRYAEPENEGEARLLLSDSIADLHRKGQVHSRMTFVEGRLLPMPYATPEGAYDFSLFTHNFKIAVSPEGGEFIAKYSLLAGVQQVSDNRLAVRWTFLE